MIREAASANQEATDRVPNAFEEIMEEKGYLPEQVFTANKCHILGLKKKSLISKEEKQALGFKAERDRLTPANAVGFMIKTALIYKTANLGALKGKNKHELPVFWLYRKGSWMTKPLFLHRFH